MISYQLSNFGGKGDLNENLRKGPKVLISLKI